MCAVFNPQVQPTQDPNYLSYAKVVEAPSPDQSTGLTIKALTEGFDSAVGIVDSSIKANIKDTATKQIDVQRDQMTAALEKVRDQTAQAPGVVPAPVQTAAGTTTGSPSLLDANASMDVPDGVDQGLERISQLSEARKAAKINDTQYSMEVLSIAKRLRSQYGTGYRDYIDQEVSKISGLPVANSYYQNLMTDINRQLTQVAGQKDKIEGLYLKNLDVPNIVSSFSQYKAGQLSESDFISKIATWQNVQTQQKIDAAARAEKKGNQEFQEKDQTERLTQLATNHVNFALKDVTQLSGMDSLPQLMKFFEDSSAGRIKASDAEVQQRIGQLTAYRASIAARLTDTASGYAATIGGDKANDIIKNAMAPLDTFIKFAQDKDTGPAFFAARQFQALKSDAELGFLVNKDTHAGNMQLIGARGTLGEQYFPDWIKGIITNTKLDQAYRGIFEQEALSTIQPYSDKRGTPVPRYMKDAIVHGKDINAPAEYFGSVTSLVSTIADPKAPLQSKDAVINWAFNPKNIGRLDELKMDYRDPNTGEMVPGKYRAFNILSSPSVTQGVLETSKAKPENYQTYQSTLEQEFGKLFRSDVMNLNKVFEASKNPYVIDGKTLAPFMQVHFSWNDQTNELGLVDKDNRPVTRDSPRLQYGRSVSVPEAGYIIGAFDVLDRVNSGLKNLANIQKNNPEKEGDVSSYIFKTLKVLNFAPGETVTGAPAEIMKSIFKARNPAATPEDLDNMLKRSK